MKLSIAEIKETDAEIFRFYNGPVPSVGQGYYLYPEHNFTFWWIHKGSVTVSTGDGSPVIAQQDEVFVCSPGVSRYQTFSDGAEITSVWLNVDWGRLKHFNFKGLPSVLDADQCPELTRLCKEVDALLAMYNVQTIGTLEDTKLSLADGLRFRSLGMELFMWLMNDLLTNGVELLARDGADARIAAAVNYLESDTFSGAVPYNYITECTGLSRVHIDRLFREQLSMSPKQFLEKRCFEKSAELLTRSGKPVYAIADELNFRSTAHFCSWFKRQCSQTPKQFRKNQLI